MMRPRLVIELNDAELNHLLRGVAFKHRKTIRETVLESLAQTYPELREQIKSKELPPENFSSPFAKDSSFQ